MFRLKLLILSFLIVTFMGATDALASMHHHHEAHDHGIVSPFDKKEEGKSQHCLLNNHQHNGGFCPHSALASGNDSTHRLSADCGGKAPGTVPSFSFHKDNLDSFSSYADLSNISFRLIAEIFSTTQQHLNSQDPPPEVL